MSERFYPNGLAHPTLPMRRRIALELAVLSGLTGLYLTVFPNRPLGVDVGLSLVAMGVIGLVAKDTRERIWGPPASMQFVRIRRCVWNMGLFTVPSVIAMGIFGAGSAWHEHLAAGGEDSAMAVAWAIAHRLFHPHFFLALVLYVPWALAQQTLFQFYLLGRLRGLLPFASPLTLSIICGMFYGAAHLPELSVAFVTTIGGAVWSYSYHRDRLVWPIAISHAIMGSTFYYWVYNENLIYKNFFAAVQG